MIQSELWKQQMPADIVLKNSKSFAKEALPYRLVELSKHSSNGNVKWTCPYRRLACIYARGAWAYNVLRSERSSKMRSVSSNGKKRSIRLLPFEPRKKMPLSIGLTKRQLNMIPIGWRVTPLGGKHRCFDVMMAAGKRPLWFRLSLIKDYCDSRFKTNPWTNSVLLNFWNPWLRMSLRKFGYVKFEVGTRPIPWMESCGYSPGWFGNF